MNPVDKIIYTEDERGCWIWAGNMASNGYGRVWDRQENRLEWAHRYSYRHLREEIPPGHEIDHMCQVTACINPDHLQPVTRAEHARITMQRLGKDDLHLAAARLRRGGYTYREIADALGLAGEGSGFCAVRAAVDKGLVDPDEVPPVIRINEDEREEMRVLYALGIPQTVIGRFYGVDSSQVSRICSGLTSGHSERKAS